MTADILIEDHGSLVLLRPRTAVGQLWLTDNLADDVMTFGLAFIAEPRYVGAIVKGACADGLEVAS